MDTLLKLSLNNEKNGRKTITNNKKLIIFSYKIKIIMEKTCVKESKILSNTSVNFAKLNFPCHLSICPIFT